MDSPPYMNSPMSEDDESHPIEEELRDLLDKMNEIIEKNEELMKPDFSLVPIWIASCIVAYVYGITMGLYMCSK